MAPSKYQRLSSRWVQHCHKASLWRRAKHPAVSQWEIVDRVESVAWNGLWQRAALWLVRMFCADLLVSWTLSMLVPPGFPLSEPFEVRIASINRVTTSSQHHQLYCKLVLPNEVMEAVMGDCSLLHGGPCGCSPATPSRDCRPSAGNCRCPLPQLRTWTRSSRGFGVCCSTVRRDGSAESRGLKAVDPEQPTLREQFAAQKQQGALPIAIRLRQRTASCTCLWKWNLDQGARRILMASYGSRGFLAICRHSWRCCQPGTGCHAAVAGSGSRGSAQSRRQRRQPYQDHWVAANPTVRRREQCLLAI